MLFFVCFSYLNRFYMFTLIYVKNLLKLIIAPHYFCYLLPKQQLKFLGSLYYI